MNEAVRPEEARSSTPAHDLIWNRRSIVSLAVAVVAAVASLWLRATVPIRPIGFAAGFFDDGLFERTAVSLAEHNWLGPLDIVTLAKGPGYSLFIASTHALGVPLKVGEQFVYLFGAALAALSYLLVRRQPISATAIFVVLVFDPSLFSSRAAGLGRDSWYSGVTLVFLGATFLTMLSLVRRTRLIITVPMAVIAGGAGAAFWLCREEGVWILPSVGVIVLGLPAMELLGRRRRRRKRESASAPVKDRTRGPGAGTGSDGRPMPVMRRIERIARPVSVALVALVAFVIPIGVVMVKNERVYGAALISDLSSGAFPEAYGAWSRVRGVPLRDYVPIDRAQRATVYPISPAARELQSFLEDPNNQWQQHGCPHLGVCDDFAGGWMPWVIRIAADGAGHFKTETDFQAFFTQLAAEINAACDSGQLQCAPALPAQVQPLLRASVTDTGASVVRWMPRLIDDPTYRDFQTDPAFGSLSDGDRALMQTGITGIPASVDEAAQVRDSFLGVQWIYTTLGLVYPPLFWLLVVLALLALVLVAAGRALGPAAGTVAVLGGALAVGVLSRLVLFGVLDTTQYLADPVYHFVTRVLLLGASAIGAMVFLEAMTGGYRRLARPPRRNDSSPERTAGTVATD